jgi:hypothetical protein
MRLLRLLSLPLLGLNLLAAGGCASHSKKNYPTTVARFLLEATNARDASAVAHLPRSGVAISVEPKSYFTEYDIENCEVVNNELGQGLAFKLTRAAATDLYKMSVPNQGKRLVTMVNGRPIGARRIDGAFSQGYIVTYVEVPEGELEAMAKNITLTSKDMREELEKQQK